MTSDEKREKLESEVTIKVLELMTGDFVSAEVVDEPVLEDGSWFQVDVIVNGVRWAASYNEDTLQWEGGPA